MRTPTPRLDERCWCCGRYASPVDITALTDIERTRLKTRVGIPHACWAHRETIEATLAEHAENYRKRTATESA